MKKKRKKIENYKPSKTKILFSSKRYFISRFKTFDFYRNDLLNVFELWDRTKGVTRSPPTPTNPTEEDNLAAGAGGKKSTQKKEKGMEHFN